MAECIENALAFTRCDAKVQIEFGARPNRALVGESLRPTERNGDGRCFKDRFDGHDLLVEQH